LALARPAFDDYVATIDETLLAHRIYELVVVEIGPSQVGGRSDQDDRDASQVTPALSRGLPRAQYSPRSDNANE
jgi:hypothetical protein